MSVLAVIAPTANAGKDRTLKSTFELPQLNIYDPALSERCGFEVVGLVEGTFEKKLVLGIGAGNAARETERFKGEITWIARASGKSYSDEIEATSKIDYPEGTDDWPLPAHVTVTGSNGGTFPFDGGLPGNGKFEYDAQIYSVSPDGFPYIFATSTPDFSGKSFQRADRQGLRRDRLTSRPRPTGGTAPDTRAKGPPVYARAVRSAPRQTRDSSHVGTSQTARNTASSIQPAPWISSVSAKTTRSAKLKTSQAPVSTIASAPRATTRATRAARPLRQPAKRTPQVVVRARAQRRARRGRRARRPSAVRARSARVARRRRVRGRRRRRIP